MKIPNLQARETEVPFDPDLWVVTVNWNQPEWTRECIQSLRTKNASTFSLVIVDNGSTDNSINILEGIPSQKLIINPTNLGFAGGFNAGLKYALLHGAEYIFMVNNDTISQPEMLDILVRDAIDLRADMASPVIYNLKSPDQIWSAGGKINKLFSAPFDGHSQNNPLPDHPIQRDFLTGCALLIHKDVFEAIGFFDEDFFLYYEDLDFAMRAKKAGLSAWLIPEAILLHHGSGSISKDTSDAYYYWMSYSSWLYFFKHLKLWQWIFVFPWRFAHSIKLLLQLTLNGRYNAANEHLKAIAHAFAAHFHKGEQQT